MDSAHRFHRLRRALLAAGLAASLAPGALLAARRPPIVTVLGDSITAGLGLAAAEALPAQLAAALARRGVHAIVRAAGVSGDTTADGLARVDFSVQADTDVCLVALGGNDLLQGGDPKAVQANLTAIVRRLKARRFGVIVAGMQAPPQIGPAYARAFDAAFPAAARAGGAVLYPDLLAGVGRDQRLLQRDAIHPNAAGARVIAERLAPVVARALAARAGNAR
jgi:acyl-CoA thioesterase-1